MKIGFAENKDSDFIKVLKSFGCEEIYHDYGKMIRRLKNGDEVFFKSLKSLKKTTRQLLKIANEISSKQVHVTGLEDKVFIDYNSPTAEVLLKIFNSGNENFRDWKGRRPKGWFHAAATVKKTQKMLEEGKYSKEVIAKKLGISLVTVYKYAKIHLEDDAI